MRLLPALLLAVCTPPPMPSSSTPSLAGPPEPTGQVAPRTEAKEVDLRRAVAETPGELVLHIDKSDRRLTVKKGGKDLVHYSVGLAPGADPTKDKVRQGDLATPEGDFTVVTRNDKSSYHLFLGISYPTAEDADRGLRAGLVSEAQARLIREADAAGRVPPWNTTLGGAIGIHGGGGSNDWTLGCIAVENDEIEALWDIAPHGTKVHIED